MSISEKDYALIAATFKARRPVINQGYYGLFVADQKTLTCLAHDLAVNLAVENANFDRASFLAACGVQPCK